MKRIVCLVTLTLLSSVIALRAQLRVDSTGNVGIHLADTVSPRSFLSVGGVGDSTCFVTVERANDSFTISRTGLYSIMTPITLFSSKYCTALSGVASVPNTGGKLLGLRAHALSTSNMNGRACGVFGMAGGATSGWNYGVIGVLQGNSTYYGAGIYGSINNVSISSVPARCAGYFNGQTRVNGDFYANTLNTTSDARLKDNVADVERDALQKIGELHPVRFNWKPVEDKSAGDTATVTTMLMSDDTDYERLHYGLLAQEVKALFPELVHEDANGYMSVNYVELIPLLIQAVQNLSEEVAILKKGNVKQAKNSSFSEASLTGIAAEAVLLQNTPNPFTTDTKIEYILPQTAQSAYLYIYNMNGVQVQAYTLNNNGKGEVIVSAGQLEAGMYFYSLIVDNSVVDTKRMILTK